MRKIFLIPILSFICTMLVSGQCMFPDYPSYGLICDEAQFLCGYEMDGYMGVLLDEDSPVPQPVGLCEGFGGTADNIQWFSFIPDDNNLEIIIQYNNCTGTVSGLPPGLQVGIYNNCELNDDNEPLGSLYCVEDYNYVDIVLLPDPADIEIGQLYYLFVDGYGGSACNYEIDVISGICVDEPDTTNVCEQDCGVMVHSDYESGCTMFVDTFFFMPSSQFLAGIGGSCATDPQEYNTMLDSIICVEWNIQPDTGFIILSEQFQYFDSLGVLPTLAVEWLLPGTYKIKPIIHFNPLFGGCGGGCICTDDIVFEYTVSETTIDLLPELELCPGECINFCDSTYCDTGTYECRFRDLCLIEIQSVVAKPNIEINEGLQFICPGECFEFQNVQYCEVDDYEVSDAESCDTTYIFKLEELIFSIHLIQADNLLNCDIKEAFLEGEWTTNFTGNIMSAWLSETGDTLSHGVDYTATDGGMFTFVAWPENMKSCEASIEHTVLKDDEAPSADLLPPLLDCNNPMDIIIVDTQDDILTVEWTGPNGFLSSDINPGVNSAGIYEATITATNGCEVVVVTEVIGDFEIPEFDVNFEPLTCSENIPTASYTSMSPIVSHMWTLPDGSESSVDVLDLNSAGGYSLAVIADNGCPATKVFNVADLSYDPSLQLSEDRIWRCRDTMITLNLSAQQSAGMNYTWTNLEGAVLSNDINLSITAPGTYVLTTVDQSLECVGKDTVRIIEDPDPFLDVEYSITPPKCAGGGDGRLEIMAMDGGTKPLTYEIDGEPITDLADVNFEAGMYMIEAIDAFGCIISKDVEIPSTDALTIDIAPVLSIRFGQNKTLTFETSLDESEIGHIEWTDDEGELLGVGRELDFVGDRTGFIYLRVENLEGCEVTAEVKVNLSFEVDIYYPNVFSPNGDGYNDFFILYNNGFPEMADDLKIFDRYGELMYKSSTTEFNETKMGWDGTFNGKPCQPGVYVFILQYTLMNGTKETISGSITLVR